MAKRKRKRAAPRRSRNTGKRRLSDAEEFEIMKLVMDKFLWLGFGVMAFGLFKILSQTVTEGVYYIVAGAAVLILFMILIVKEYEFIRY